MKRVVLALAAMLLGTCAMLAGSASASVSGVTFDVTATSITVNGTEIGCIDVGQDGVPTFTLRFQLLDSDNNPIATRIRTAKLGKKWKAVVFDGLQSGTTYRVVISDNACNQDFSVVDDENVTTLGGEAEAAAEPQGPDRYIFCAVAGNTDLDGNPIAPGTSLNLEPDQVVSDEHYKGATIGFFVAGLGATCQLTPEQAALAAASTTKVNHVGGTGDYNQPELYTFVG